MRTLHLIQARETGGTGTYQGSKTYAWTVFALSFGLILSDYLSRQAVGAVFPFLKPVWGVSDSQLGALVSIVSLVVGVMTIPLSLIADRWGRVKSITLMAFVWCFATIACGLATSYTQMLVARAMVGFGEAAYAAAGAALLAHTFPGDKRSAVLGAFQSGGIFGSVMGVVIGGAVASQFGWRYAFFAVGAPGLLLAVLYPIFVRDYQVPALQEGAAGNRVDGRPRFAEVFRQVFAARSGNFTFAAFGLQMGIPAILIAWVPTYFNRFYGYDPKKASLIAAVVVLVLGVGMLFGGGVADWLSKGRPRYRALVPAAYALISALMLFAAFALPPGVAGLVLLLGGALFAAAHGGAAVAMLIDVTHPAVHATVTATAVLGANLLGTAPGPYLVGLLSDVANLRTALTLAPLMSLAAAVLFLLAARYYEADIAARKAAG
ncbi:MFS transporter [Paraburkholderia sediminicola]|jgi:predicted MFS family arabinose efflux permease|uniref:MFS transporter n=1 Tax=Paraburkholderia sediminicola TaxID=458836 RepID=UPI0038BB1AB1